ncbi:MAG TPA: alkaline phosphatase D family protein [Nitrospiraceae bacterium]|nr:alkaline phosphatase D family protein [Nitrospiraceae bacterium]
MTRRKRFRYVDRMRNVRCRVLAITVATAAGLGLAGIGCSPSHLPGLPPGSPFAEAGAPGSLFPQGVAIGDVSNQSVVLWLRTEGPARIGIEHGILSTGRDPDVQSFQPINHQPLAYETGADRDYTLSVLLDDLRPGTSYGFRITAVPSTQAEDRPGSDPPSETVVGRFKTLPDPQAHGPVEFGWSADLGGQAYCRDTAAGYPIFDVARQFTMDFFLLLGDTIYADEICPAPPNAPGSNFTAATLDAYRAKHRYQRGSPALQRFVASVPVYVVWDDHEVRNNFSGPFDEKMPVGRQALFEYWPIGRDPRDPDRLYRRLRAGSTVEIFILDTRQYRSRNGDPDGPRKTMLGDAQLAWLLEGLAHSSATWKVIASSVPLSVPKKAPLHTPGSDGWVKGDDGTGFETELKRIADWIVSRNIRNVVWLAADVHFVQANAYDVDRDGRDDFHEFIAGPLSAAGGRMAPPRSPFRMRTLVYEGGYRNFGIVRTDETSFDVKIIDEAGQARFSYHIPVQ